MIRNVVIHISNEQPLLADIYSLPQATDAGLVCTNLRTPDGKRPVFIDDSAATFFFPYLHIRFLEIPVGALEGYGALSAGTPGAGAAAADPSVNGNGHGPGHGSADASLAAAISAQAAATKAAEEADEADLELDEDFLRRIREV